MIDFKDFEEKDGHINWEKYHKAQKNNGEKCCSCSQTIILGGKGYPQKCFQCKDLEAGQETQHKNSIRCPACGYIERINWETAENIYDEGEHEIFCGECDEKYLVETSVSYTFKSVSK